MSHPGRKILFFLLLSLPLLFSPVSCGREAEKKEAQAPPPQRGALSTEPGKREPETKPKEYPPLPRLAPEEEAQAAVLSASLEQEDFLHGWEKVKQLISMGRGVLPLAVKLLSSQEEGARLKGLFILEELADERIASNLIGLLKDPSPAVKALAAELFGKLMKSNDIFLIGELLSSLNDPSGAVTASTALALYRVGYFFGIPVLVEDLRKGNWKGDESIEALKMIYGEDLGYQAAFGKKDLEDSYLHWREKYQSDRKTLQGFINELDNYKAIFTMKAREILIAIGLPAQDALLEVLKSENDYIRYEAVEILEKVGDRKAVKNLKALLKDENYRVRAATAGAIFNLGGKEAIPLLFPLLKDPSPDVRMEGIRLLAEAKDPAALPALLSALQAEGNRDFRTNLARAVRLAGEVAEIPQLISSLKKGDGKAAESLARITGIKLENTARSWERWWVTILKESGS